MKNHITIKNIIQILTLIFWSFLAISCHRDELEEDDIPQEEITNVILNIKNLETGNIKSYNYFIGAPSVPVIQLDNGKSYEVQTVFMNGDEDVTQEIREAKEEHFMIFNFPKSNITLTRLDPATSTREDGNRVGLLTKWDVNYVANSENPLVIITLIHEAAAVNEALDGTSWGSVKGGETDAEITFGLSN